MNSKICEMVTERILAELDKGVVPWRKPWVAAGAAKSHATGKSYSLLNQLMLEDPGEYATMKQINDEGGTVKKGSKSKTVVFWKVFKTGSKDEDTGEFVPDGRLIPYLRYYRVFHIKDTEGIKAKYPEPPLPDCVNPIERAENAWRDYCGREGIRIDVETVRDAAYYSPCGDFIEVPSIKQYQTAAEYYSTIFHELGHSTGHKKRLARDMTGGKGSKKYAQEELTAEITAAVICTTLGIETSESIKNSAAYLKSWRDRIAEDNTLIVVAAGRAQKAVDRILGIKRETESESEPETKEEMISAAA